MEKIINHITENNILYLCELYDIIIPYNIENKIEYAKNEFFYYDEIINREKIIKMYFFNYKTKDSFIKDSFNYTIKEILDSVYPIKIYEWIDRIELCDKIWDLYEKINNYEYNLTLLKLLKYYYDKPKKYNLLYNQHLMYKMIYFEEYLNFDKNSSISTTIINEKILNYDDTININYININEEKLIKNQINFNIWEQRGNLLIDLFFIIKYCENIENIIYSGSFEPKYLVVIKNIFFDKNIYFYDKNKNYKNYALIHHCKTFDLKLVNKPMMGLIPYTNVYNGINIKIPWYNFLLNDMIVTDFYKTEIIKNENGKNIYFSLFENNIDDYVIPECYDHCLDCTLELNIIIELIKYLKNKNIKTSIDYWNTLITSILNEKRGL